MILTERSRQKEIAVVGGRDDRRLARWEAGWSANAKRWSAFDERRADDDSVFRVMLTSSTLICSEVALAEKV